VEDLGWDEMKLKSVVFLFVPAGSLKLLREGSSVKFSSKSTLGRTFCLLLTFLIRRTVGVRLEAHVNVEEVSCSSFMIQVD